MTIELCRVADSRDVMAAAECEVAVASCQMALRATFATDINVTVGSKVH